MVDPAVFFVDPVFCFFGLGEARGIPPRENAWPAL